MPEYPSGHPVPGGSTPFRIESPSFNQGAAIPRKHTCEAENVSPELVWTDAPAGTKSLALVCEDPDAAMAPWVHWVIYAIPPSVRGLKPSQPTSEELPEGIMQGKNSGRRIGYSGPCPPPGKPHRYYFKLYALDAELPLGTGVEKKDLEKAMRGHILAQTEVMGLYSR